MKTKLFALARGARCRGASAVEFALILPLLILLLFAMVEASIAIYDKAIITNASREAARAGVVMGKTRLSDPEIQQVALNYCGDRLIGFGETGAQPTVTVERPPSPMSADPLSVSVSYVFHGFGLGRLYTAFAGPIQLTATTVMAYE